MARTRQQATLPLPETGFQLAVVDDARRQQREAVRAEKVRAQREADLKLRQVDLPITREGA